MAVLIEDDQNIYIQHRLLYCADTLQQCASAIIDLKWQIEKIATAFSKTSDELQAVVCMLADKESVDEPKDNE